MHANMLFDSQTTILNYLWPSIVSLEIHCNNFEQGVFVLYISSGSEAREHFNRNLEAKFFYL